MYLGSIDIPDPIPVPVDADGLGYGYEYDLVALAVIPYFDLTSLGGIVLDYPCVPTGAYVILANTVEPIARHVCRVAGASLVCTSAVSTSTTPAARAGASR